MDMDPRHGLRRVLFVAQKQFATASGHPELFITDMDLLEFSDTGSPFGRFGGFAPEPKNDAHKSPRVIIHRIGRRSGVTEE
jgi:hypothetical protein